MKHLGLASLLLVCAVGVVHAQEKPTKQNDRKTLVVQADAKPQGEGVAAAAAPAEKVPDKLVAPETSVPKGPAEIAHAFFTWLEKGDIDAAYGGLTRNSKIAERPEELRGLKAKTKEAIDVFGVVRGYDLAESKPVGERLVRATYISLGKEFPLRWRFYFYKAEDVWRLIDLRVDDKLTGIFDELEEVKTVEKP